MKRRWQRRWNRTDPGPQRGTHLRLPKPERGRVPPGTQHQPLKVGKCLQLLMELEINQSINQKHFWEKLLDGQRVLWGHLTPHSPFRKWVFLFQTFLNPLQLYLRYSDFGQCSCKAGFRNIHTTSCALLYGYAHLNLSKFNLTFRQISSHVNTNTMVAGQNKTAWAAWRQSPLANSVVKMNFGIWAMIWKSVMLN